jgi:carboxymethylenebutenolidase
MASRRELTIPVEPGVEVGAYLSLPAAAEGAPAVVVLGEIWGVNANIRAICDRLAEAGAIAVAPDQYRGIVPPREGDPREHVMGFFERFDDPQGIRDGRAAIAAVRNGALGIVPDRIFVWGFCLGGRFAHYLAAFEPRLAGAINFYGRLNFPRQEHLKPFVPLDVAGLVNCPYLGLFGEIDPFIPASDVAALRAELRRLGVPHHVGIYDGAEHAFFNEMRPSYHAGASADAWRRVQAFIFRGEL